MKRLSLLKLVRVIAKKLWDQILIPITAKLISGSDLLSQTSTSWRPKANRSNQRAVSGVFFAIAAVSSFIVFPVQADAADFTARESSRSWRGVASSADGVKLAAVTNNGYLYTSADSGVIWTERTSLGQKSWYAVASSNDGTKLAAVADSKRIFTSIDSGATWTEQFGSNSNVQWRSVASSADGTKLIAAANQDRIYTSTDSGLTWTSRYNNGNWSGVASSADGTKLVAVENSGNIYTSTNSGATWTARMTDQSRSWFSVASSADGIKLVASDYSGFLYTSIDSGVTWTARDSSRLWRLVASSADGSQLMAAEQNGLLYVSSDSGVSWTTIDSLRNWWGVAISADGAKLLASVFGGQLFTLGSAPEIAVEQPSLNDLTSGAITDFGQVLVGETAVLEFTIRNPGTETLTGLGITIDGIDAALFTLTASPVGPLTGPSGSTTFTVRFAPMSTGLKSASLHIASNDGDENPFDIVLNGTGTVPTPEIAVEKPELTDLMTGAMQDFGSTAANNTSDLIFTIRNSGTADLTGVEVMIDGTDSALFTVTATPDSVISPAGSTTFTVRFAPVSIGLKSATLHIASNDSDENPFDISLTGTGTPEQMIAHESNRNWRGVASSADGVKLVAIAANSYPHFSTDSGMTWTQGSVSTGPKSWYDVASSADGTKLVAVADGARIHTSIDSGATWTEQFGSNSNVQWRSVASSADGTKLIAAADLDRIYTSADSGITWTVRYNSGNWNGVASSADGTKLVAVEDTGNIFTSTDSGATWTARMTDQSRNWSSVASSADGIKLVASDYSGFLYTSIDSGVTWTARDSSRSWRLVASSADGSQLMGAERDGLLYVSSDSGVSWTTIDSLRNWWGVAISADGAKLLASVFGGQLYTIGTESDLSQSGPDFIVNTLSDHDDGIAGDVDCTLREAINAANANSDDSIITFDSTLFATGQVLQLAAELPALNSNLEIQGPTAGVTLRRDTGGDYRILLVNSGTTVALSNLTLTNGNQAVFGGGGGIQNYGTLTVTDCTITGNTAAGEGGGIESFGPITVTSTTISGNQGNWGGGITNWGSATVIGSTISGNSATTGGGGFLNFGSSFTVLNSTISGNTALNGGGIESHVNMTLINSTISGNTATGSTVSDGGGAMILQAETLLESCTVTGNSAVNGARGGIWQTSETLTMYNTIVAGNLTQDIQRDAGSLVSNGYNLIGISNVGASFNQAGDQVAVTNPGLGELGYYGGSTQTHVLLSNSSAINLGDPGFDPENFSPSLTDDQRGYTRVKDGRVDIGAYESGNAAGFAIWIRESLPSGIDVSDYTLISDNDGDGRNNLLEYGILGSPTQADTTSPLDFELNAAGTTSTIVLPIRFGAPDLTYAVDSTSDLRLPWNEIARYQTSTATFTPLVSNVAVMTSDAVTLTITDANLSGETQYFYRLRLGTTAR